MSYSLPALKIETIRITWASFRSFSLERPARDF